MLNEADFARLEAIEADWVARERKQEPDPEFWRWSPTPLPKVREMFATADMCRELAELEHRPTFFDAGCGIGTKMYLAFRMFGWAVYGWDLYPEYIEFARRQFGIQPEVRDLRKHEPDWAAYDVIMTSRPFKDDAEETAWERRVQEAMRPGAVLIGTHLGVKPYSWRWLYRAPWRLVAVKPLPGEQDHTQANVPNMRPAT